MTIDIQEYNKTIEANKRAEYQKGYDEGMANKRVADYKQGYEDGVRDVFRTVCRAFGEYLGDDILKFKEK